MKTDYATGSDVKGYLTPGQLAQVLGISPGTLANYRSAGTGPRFVKVGPLVRYRPADVERWIADETEASPTGSRRDDGDAA